MLTLTQNDKTIQIAKLVEGKSTTPIYWHPTQNDELMSAVHDIGTFNNAYFRDRFELSADQASEIFQGLADERVVEKNQSKYYDKNNSIASFV